jgi:hypothetical protein
MVGGMINNWERPLHAHDTQNHQSIRFDLLDQFNVARYRLALASQRSAVGPAIILLHLEQTMPAECQ